MVHDWEGGSITKKKFTFNLTKAQSRFAIAVHDIVLGPPPLTQHNRRSFSVVPDPTYSVKKQGSKIETKEWLGGTEDNIVSPTTN